MNTMCCKWMREILVTLAVALPLIVLVRASHAQTTRLFDLGRLICSIIPEQNIGRVTILPPQVDAYNWLYWVAAVHHWDASNNYTGYTWTNGFYYIPPDRPYYLRPGGWIDPTTGQGFFVTPAHALGYVLIQPFVWDDGIKQWILYGPSGPSCLVFTNAG
jgi:hypothetical protein